METEMTTGQRDAPTTRAARRTYFFVIGPAIALIALVFIGIFIQRHMSSVPADLNLATTQLSAQGFYQVTITPQPNSIPINQLHTWTLRVTQPDGRPIEQARITVDGDMPQHGHGLPTQPQVTQHLGNGDYLVEGMKFQMGGWWVVDFVIEADGRRDTVRFNLVLE